ncbi:MAG: hypothetical protein ACFFE7_16245 [Candidatus Thorarchaeota archaeon]
MNEIILGFFFAGAEQKSVSSEDAAHNTSLSMDKVTRNMSFLTEAGFLIPEGRAYRLSEAGAEFGKYLSWNMIPEAESKLATILDQYELTSKVLHYVRLAGPVSRSDVIARMGVLSGIGKKGSYERGLETLLDWLIFARLLEESEKGIVISKRKKIPLIESPTEKLSNQRPVEVVGRHQIPISINITIDSQMSPDKLKKLLSVIKKELLEPKTGKSDEQSQE